MLQLVPKTIKCCPFAITRKADWVIPKKKNPEEGMFKNLVGGGG